MSTDSEVPSKGRILINRGQDAFAGLFQRFGLGASSKEATPAERKSAIDMASKATTAGLDYLGDQAKAQGATAVAAIDATTEYIRNAESPQERKDGLDAAREIYEQESKLSERREERALEIVKWGARIAFGVLAAVVVYKRGK